MWILFCAQLSNMVSLHRLGDRQTGPKRVKERSGTARQNIEEDGSEGTSETSSVSSDSSSSKHKHHRRRRHSSRSRDHSYHHRSSYHPYVEVVNSFPARVACQYRYWGDMPCASTTEVYRHTPPPLPPCVYSPRAYPYGHYYQGPSPYVASCSGGPSPPPMMTCRPQCW